VYFYPDNLGIMAQVFNRRVMKVLKEYNLKKELFRFRWYLLNNDKDLVSFAQFGLIMFLILMVSIAEYLVFFYALILILLASLGIISSSISAYKRYWKDVDDRFK